MNEERFCSNCGNYSNDRNCHLISTCWQPPSFHNMWTPIPISFTEELINREQDVLNFKATEYSNKFNRFLNFEEVGEMIGLPREIVCLTYLLKHIQSIALALREDNIHWFWVDQDGNEGLKNRIVDARNYLLLLGEIIDDNENKREENINVMDHS